MRELQITKVCEGKWGKAMRKILPLLTVTFIVIAITCGKESTTGPTESTVPEFINFFPIAEGNKWIYATLYNDSGIDQPDINIVGEEVVEIIKHNPPSDSFRIQITANAIARIQTDKGDSVIYISNKIDTLLAAMKDSVLKVVESTIDRISQLRVPLFPSCATYIKVVLPDTNEIQVIKQQEPGNDRTVCYIIIKNIGFQEIRQFWTRVIGGSTSKLELEEFIPAVIKSD
jgi:hypothetical protein